MRKRLALFYKWGNEPVELIKFFRGEIDAAAGGRTEFQRGIMGMLGAVEKEIMGTTAQLRTSVTDIRRFFKSSHLAVVKEGQKEAHFLLRHLEQREEQERLPQTPCLEQEEK